MAITKSVAYSQIQGFNVGPLRARLVDVALAATTDYTTGGVAITANEVSLSEILGVQVLGLTGTTAATAQRPVWDQANKKLLLYVGAAGVDVEQTNAANVVVTVRLLVFGV